jgi:hypothetical protein
MGVFGCVFDYIDEVVAIVFSLFALGFTRLLFFALFSLAALQLLVEVPLHLL